MEKETVLKAPQKGYEKKDGTSPLFPFTSLMKKNRHLKELVKN